MDRKIQNTRGRALCGPLAAASTALLLAACGGSHDGLVQLSEARPASLLSCTDLAGKISFPNTRITGAETVAAGTLTMVGKAPDRSYQGGCSNGGRHAMVAVDRVIASARGAGNARGVNADLPANWSASRTRPLCPHPHVARYNGSGDMESAASYSCR